MKEISDTEMYTTLVVAEILFAKTSLSYSQHIKRQVCRKQYIEIQNTFLYILCRMLGSL